MSLKDVTEPSKYLMTAASRLRNVERVQWGADAGRAVQESLSRTFAHELFKKYATEIKTHEDSLSDNTEYRLRLIVCTPQELQAMLDKAAGLAVEQAARELRERLEDFAKKQSR